MRVQAWWWAPRRWARMGETAHFTRHTPSLAGVLPALVLWLLMPANAVGQAGSVDLTPDRGPAAGGTVVLLEVEEAVLLGPVRVEFGGQPASQVRRLGLSILEVVTPPGNPGPVPVRVVYGLWGSSTAQAVFTYTPPTARLLRLNPSTVAAGGADLVLAAEGDNFAPTSTLRVGDAPVLSTFVTPQRLLARVPAELLATPGSLEVRVTDTALGGGTSDVASLTVVNPSPQLAAVEAAPLQVGGPPTSIIVRGRDFRRDSVVHLAGTPMPTQYRSSGELAVAIPPDRLTRPGELSVTVMTPGPGGGTSNVIGLAVQPAFPGRFLVFTSDRSGGRNHIYLLDRQTGRLDPLAEANSANGTEGYPSISADGRLIVFQSDRHFAQTDIFLFDRETRILDLLPELNHPTAFDGFPHISPDGRFIVFESDRENRRPKIFLFDRNARRLSELSQANEATADDGLAAISN